MAKEIRMEEGKLKVIFEIRDNGVVELKQFDPAGRADVRERKREPKRSVWNMSLRSSIRDSVRAGKNRILKKRVCIRRITAGTVRASGEKMTVGRSI